MRDAILFLAVLALCSVLSDAQQVSPTDKAALAREWPSAPQIEAGPTLLRRPACSLHYANASDGPSLPCSWTRRNRHLLVGFLTLQAADYAATERGFDAGHWHERNPLVPSTSAGRAGYFAATAGCVLLASYALDHAGHRKMASALLWAAGGVEAHAAVRSWSGL